MSGTRGASCGCGQLGAECAGEPVRVSVCHCLDCRRRSGSAFSAQARFREESVAITGEARIWRKKGEGGNVAEFGFCPDCGSTVFYRIDATSIASIPGWKSWARARSMIEGKR